MYTVGRLFKIYQADVKVGVPCMASSIIYLICTVVPIPFQNPVCSFRRLLSTPLAIRLIIIFLKVFVVVVGMRVITL
jgi:hypothetical protein